MTFRPDHCDVIQGNSLYVLDELPESSFHAIVTDPPYGISFMDEEWDTFCSERSDTGDDATEKAPAPDVPGENYEYHRWCMVWAEKAQRVLKPGGHVIAFSGNRTHHRMMAALEDVGYEIRDTITWHFGDGFSAGSYQKVGRHLDGELEEKFGDFRYGLKPATQFAVLARNPFGGSTTGCVRDHQTAVLNVPGTTIGEEARYPSNLILDSTMAEVIDGMGPQDNGGGTNKTFNEEIDTDDADVHDGYVRPNRSAYTNNPEGMVRSYGDSGGASRFFYCTKPATSEKTHDGSVENDHPTVKPVDLMEWLVKLVTAESQWVLDPFVGSGTTILAADRVDRNAVGIEADSDYVEIARDRVAESIAEA